MYVQRIATIQNSDPIVRFLTNIGGVVTQLIYVFDRKIFVSHFGLLQTNNLWGVFIYKSFKLMQTSTNAIYVKRDNFNDTPTPKFFRDS